MRTLVELGVDKEAKDKVSNLMIIIIIIMIMVMMIDIMMIYDVVQESIHIFFRGHIFWFINLNDV